MTEWLILALLVPAIVVPVVLLVGFAGCGFEIIFTRASINTAEGTSGTAIALTWTVSGDSAASVVEVEFDRMKLPERSRDTFKVPHSIPHKFVDNDAGQGLLPGTIYHYRSRAILSGGTEGAWSHPDEPNVAAATFPFQTIFEWTNLEEGRSRDAPGWQGNCLIQRIEPVRLSDIRTIGLTLIKLTVRAAEANDAVIERIYISTADGSPGSDPYDSAGDLTPYTTTSLVVESAAPTERSTTLEPPIKYQIDRSQALLIAVDFNISSVSEVRGVDNVSPLEASVYFKPAAQEAATADRTGFTLATGPGLLFIDKIEVA